MPQSQHRIGASCRQVAECIYDLQGWLDRNARTLKSLHPALREGVDLSAGRLETLIEAERSRPTLGLIGTGAAPRVELALSWLEAAVRPASMRDATARIFTTDVLQRLLAVGPDQPSAIAIRLAGGGSATPPQYPVQAALLSETELIETMALAGLRHIPGVERVLPDVEAIGAFFADAPEQMQRHTASGLSAKALLAIRDNLMRVLPSSRLLALLDASRYWQQLGAFIPYMSRAQFVDALSLLWGRDAESTRLYTTLAEGLDALQQAREVFLPLEALATTDGTTGWLVRHPLSILAAHTTASAGEPATVRVARRQTAHVELERSVIAGLAAEIAVQPSHRWQLDLGDLDTVVFPAPCPALELAGTAARQIAGRIRGLAADEARNVFLLAKSAFLLDRAARRMELTALVVCADPERDLDSVTVETIDRWVVATHGETPAAREKVRAGLFIWVDPAAATQPGRHPVRANPELQREQLLRSVAERVFGLDETLAVEWTTNRAFRNVFAAEPDGGARWSEAGSLSAADQTAARRAPFLHAVRDVMSERVKQQQLAAQLTEVRAGAAARFIRLSETDDPVVSAEWRRRLTNVAYNCLLRLADDRDLGRVRRAFMVSEGEYLQCLTAFAGETGRRGETSDPDPDLAERLIGHWIARLARRVRAPVFARTLRMPQPVLLNMVDEISVAVVRCDLAARIQLAFRAIDDEAAETRLRRAAQAAYIVNAFVETFDCAPPPRGAQRGGAGLGRGRPLIDVKGSALGPAAETAWASAYVALVEQNLTAASVVSVTTGGDRELGSILANLSSKT